MNETESLVKQVASRLPRWLAPLLVLSGLVLAYGAAERGYEFYQTGSIMKALAAPGFGLLAVFNLVVAFRLMRRKV